MNIGSASGPVSIAGHHEMEVVHWIGGIDVGHRHCQRLGARDTLVEDDRASGYAVANGGRGGQLGLHRRMKQCPRRCS